MKHQKLNKATSFMIIFTMLFSFIPSFTTEITSEAQTSNLIMNGDFEAIIASDVDSVWDNFEPVSGWVKTYVDPNNSELIPTFDVVQDDADPTNHVLMISSVTADPSDSEGNIRAMVTQEQVLVFGSNKYNLNANIKTDVTSGKGAYIQITYYDTVGNKINGAGVSTNKINDFMDWGSVQLELSPPAEAANLKIQLIMDTGIGTVWFDDVELTEVQEIFISSINIIEDTISLNGGDSTNLSMEVHPMDHTEGLKWESLNPSVATVDANGIVTAVVPGTTTITASNMDGTISDTVAVTVNDQTPGDGQPTYATEVINQGFEFTYTDDANSDWDGLIPEDWPIVWTDRGDPIIEIDPAQAHSGSKALKISAAGAVFEPGETAVRGTVSQKVSVDPTKKYEINIWVKTENISGSGAFFQIIYSDANDQKITGETVTSQKIKADTDWTLLQLNVESPLDAAIMQVQLNADLSTGTVWFDDIELIETIEIQNIVMNESTIQMVSGEMATLNVQVDPMDATESIIWESSLPSVAVVDHNGHLTAIGPGTSNITASNTDGSISAFVEVHVTGDHTIHTEVLNSGFEITEPAYDLWTDLAAADWPLLWKPVGNPSISVTEDQFHSGSKSLQITSMDNGRASVTQVVPISELQKHTLSAWIKTDNATGGASYRALYIDSNGDKVGVATNTDKFKGTNDWKQVVLNTIPPAGAVEMKVQLFLEEGTGSVWFDDISIHSYDLNPIEVTPANYYLGEGDTTQLQVHIRPDISAQDVSWSSSEPSIATVDNNGLVAGLDTGTVEISAETTNLDGTIYTATSIITVYGPVFMFETGEVPTQFETNDASELTLSTEHFKDGTSSLRWDYSAGSQVILSHPTGFSGKETDTFGVWIYNENPIEDELLFEFGHNGQVDASFTFGLDFEGWRTAWVPYHDMTGNPVVEMDHLVISAPSSLGQGTLFFDQFVMNDLVDTRYPTRDIQVPFVNPEQDEQDMYTWNAVVLFDQWLKEASNEVIIPTQAELDSLTTIAENYRKYVMEDMERVDASLKGEEPVIEGMEELRAEFQTYEIVRENGSIKGRPVNFKHLKDIYPSSMQEEMLAVVNALDLRDYTDFMFNVAQYYHITTDPTEKTELKTMFIDLADHFRDQGWAWGSSQGILHHIGYNNRSLAPAMWLMKDELEEAGLLPWAQDMMVWYSGVGRMYEPVDRIYANIDTLNTLLRSMVASILILDDEERQVQYMRRLTEWLSEGLTPAPGLMPAFKVDGSGFHHKGFYPHYTRDAFIGMTPVVYMLGGTEFGISEEAHESVKHALLATRLYSNKYNWLVSIAGRHPTGVYGISSFPFKYMALAGTPDGLEAIDPDMAAAYLRLIEPLNFDDTTQSLLDLGYEAELDPNGSWTMNYGALQLHRRDNWLVGVKGHNRYVWSTEIYTNANWYGRYISYGQIQILGQGDPVNSYDSGHTDLGYDWNRWSGTTTIHLPFDELKASQFSENMLNDETFAGGLNIEGENGMFAMKLHEIPRYDESHRARKSVFMFDDRIIALGSNIENTDDVHSTETTLFQNHMKSQDEPIWLSDTKAITTFPYEDNLLLTEPMWMVDNKQNGYYIPEDQNVGLHRKTQNSKDQKDGSETQGDFTTAWLDHGKAPTGEEYEYAIIVGADANEMQTFIEQMSQAQDQPYEVLQKDYDAHIVKDLATRITGYALFEANDAIHVGHVAAVDTPSMVMIRENGNQLVLSVVDPDLRLYEGLDPDVYDADGNFVAKGPYDRWWEENESIVHTMQLTIVGEWNVKEQGGNYRIVSNNNGFTVIEFDNQHAMPIEIELIPVNEIVDTTALSEAIEEADLLLLNHDIGTGVGDVSAPDQELLQVELASAQVVLDDADNSSQEVINSTELQLRTAIDTFEASIIQAAGDLSELSSIIIEAQLFHDEAEEGHAAGTYPIGSKQILQGEIQLVQGILDDAVNLTQGNIDQAVLSLQEALDQFKELLKTSNGNGNGNNGNGNGNNGDGNKGNKPNKKDDEN
ncbi:chondroitinase family polysaccharide lyase [Chengkuizengella axinellae]|uniref:Chondroitinase family polysaccharide lyase n=1 Tax=Chengkuizengella axinellae TaxID=3064388 RepID=A0ABT9IZJ1_9BACL|nr:chondroitinase family polysaccharide lyase [Chengkuizengella sp. 2205SS18-9]MDP5274786.1 chondroitinase family polysaccharide lyase [Chengkuizengella sp. 2205SS18-9]